MLTAEELRTLTQDDKLNWERTEQVLPERIQDLTGEGWKIILFHSPLPDSGEVLLAKAEQADVEDRFFVIINGKDEELDHRAGKALHRSVMQTFIKLSCPCALAGKG